MRVPNPDPCSGISPLFYLQLILVSTILSRPQSKECRSRLTHRFEVFSVLLSNSHPDIDGIGHCEYQRSTAGNSYRDLHSTSRYQTPLPFMVRPIAALWYLQELEGNSHCNSYSLVVILHCLFRKTIIISCSSVAGALQILPSFD